MHTHQTGAAAKPARAASLTRRRVCLLLWCGGLQVLIWDLSKSLMDPVVTYTHYKNADFIADLEAQAVSAKVDVSLEASTTRFGVSARTTTAMVTVSFSSRSLVPLPPSARVTTEHAAQGSSGGPASRQPCWWRSGR